MSVQTCGRHGNYVIYIHTVSSPCVLLLTSLRSEEVILEKSACGRHGNDVICMRTKFLLHACYR